MKSPTANRPLILAHRGASRVAPENTIAAFRLAREVGADGIELDVTLTRDRVPVVIHDDTVDRTTGGHGKVSELTILEIKQLDAGAWSSPAFTGETIPTLAEVFDALAEWLKPGGPGRKPRGIINVELKNAMLGTDGVERQVVNLIAQKNLEDRVILSSFSPFALARVKGLNPRLVRGLLYDLSLPVYLRRGWLRFIAAPHALHPEHAIVDAAYMQWARTNKYAVNTWTVDEPEAAVRLAALGVNALITNRPDVIRQAFG